MNRWLELLGQKRPSPRADVREVRDDSPAGVLRADIPTIDGSPQYSPEHLREIASLIAKHPAVVEVTLIGSRNKRNPSHGPKPWSDYDIVVEVAGLTDKNRAEIEGQIRDTLNKAGFWTPRSAPTGGPAMGLISLLLEDSEVLTQKIEDKNTLDVVAQAVRSYGEVLFSR